MSERESGILETFEKVLLNLTGMEREHLPAFGEGMVFKKDCAEQTKTDESDK